MMKIFSYLKENKLLGLMLVCYLLLVTLLPQKGMQAFNESIYYFVEMIMIMPVIFILTALIEAWVPKESIMNHLGKNSGVKGMLFAFLLGSFSAGPIYAAFPICMMLIKKGANLSNVVIILSTWAVVKIPMLINEAQFLGLKFTAIRWVLTTICIFIIAYLVDVFVKMKDIPNLEMAEQSVPVKIDKNYCVGCTICKRIAPSVFDLQDKKAFVTETEMTPELLELAKLAATRCPAKVISVQEIVFTQENIGKLTIQAESST